MYIFDEPTTGLHFEDIQQLLKVFYDLRSQGHSLCIVEHNLDVISQADWIIDLGPSGGRGGGRVVAQGSPETLAQSKSSVTGKWLRL